MEQNKLFTAEPDLIVGADVIATTCGLTTTDDVVEPIATIVKDLLG